MFKQAFKGKRKPMPKRAHADSRMEAKMARFTVRDWWIAIGLVAFALAFLLFMANPELPPAEDAAMLMRYAVHLAEGHGIVWNIGEPPVDGATDFLFMILIAGLVKLGVKVEIATRLLIAGAHIATVGLLYWFSRKVLGVAPWVGVLAGFTVATGAAPLYVSTCFGAPVFAFFAVCAWLCAVYFILYPPEVKVAAAFGLFSLLTGLTRPEGVFLTLLMLIAIVAARGIAHAKLAIGMWILFVVGLGGIYFLWRWDYFGQPLPNPFYKKGGGALYIGGLKNSIRNVLGFNLPLLPLIITALIPPLSRRLLLAATLPVVGFTLLFILISDEMNIYGRFQYVTFPMTVVIAILAYRALKDTFPFPVVSGQPNARLYGVAAALSCAYYILAYSLLVIYGHATAPFADGRYFVAQALAPLANRGYYMAVTEAGLLPFYSRWKAIDAWGLNDKHIARSGIISEEYLSRYKPTLIIAHIRWTPLTPVRRANKWDEMCSVLIDYARKNRYILVAAYTDNPYGDSCHLYYLRRDIPEADKRRIAQAIRQEKYVYWTRNMAFDLVPLLRARDNFGKGYSYSYLVSDD